MDLYKNSALCNTFWACVLKLFTSDPAPYVLLQLQLIPFWVITAGRLLMKYLQGMWVSG